MLRLLLKFVYYNTQQPLLAPHCLFVYFFLFNCSDIDECAVSSAVCQNSSTGSHCVNLLGEFACLTCQATDNQRFWNYYGKDECCLRSKICTMSICCLNDFLCIFAINCIVLFYIFTVKSKSRPQLKRKQIRYFSYKLLTSSRILNIFWLL